jgi:solute carrier family 27 (fatty acid transporter), member 1/4
LANFFSAQGYSRGDVIALVLENSLEYPCVWVALSKIGCITALINTNLRSKSLQHSIETVKAKSVITSKEILAGELDESNSSVKLIEYSVEIESDLKELNMKKVYLFDSELTLKQKDEGNSRAASASKSIQLYEQLEGCSIEPPPPAPYDLKRTSQWQRSRFCCIYTSFVSILDPVFYIFTSGTTGLPKAAVIKHSRYDDRSPGFDIFLLHFTDFFSVALVLSVLLESSLLISCTIRFHCIIPWVSLS